MSKIIIVYLPYLLSLVTVYTTLLAGNKNKLGWIIATINQFLWLIWILAVGAYGLLIGNILLTIICFRNYLKWEKESLSNNEFNSWRRRKK